MFFHINILAALSALSVLAIATPLTSSGDEGFILTRDAPTPCSPGGQPILYKNYSDQGPCGPAKHLSGLDTDGSIICPGTHNSGLSGPPSCDTWCEVYQEFVYGVEAPVIANPYCHGPLTCTVTEQQAFTWTFGGQLSGSADLIKVLNAGIQGGFSYASAKTQIVTKSVTLKQGECGYMTFLPELHRSCGTHSKGIWGNNQCNEYTTEYDVCYDQPNRSADGSEVIGTTVFVWADCSTNERLPMDKQDPAYQHDGVALPQSNFVSIFMTCNCNEDGCSDDSPACCDNGSCPASAGVVGGGGGS